MLLTTTPPYQHSILFLLQYLIMQIQYSILPNSTTYTIKPPHLPIITSVNMKKLFNGYFNIFSLYFADRLFFKYDPTSGYSTIRLLPLFEDSHLFDKQLIRYQMCWLHDNLQKKVRIRGTCIIFVGTCDCITSTSGIIEFLVSIGHIFDPYATIIVSADCVVPTLLQSFSYYYVTPPPHANSHNPIFQISPSALSPFPTNTAINSTASKLNSASSYKTTHPSWPQ